MKQYWSFIVSRTRNHGWTGTQRHVNESFVFVYRDTSRTTPKTLSEYERCRSPINVGFGWSCQFYYSLRTLFLTTEDLGLRLSPLSLEDRLLRRTSEPTDVDPVISREGSFGDSSRTANCFRSAFVKVPFVVVGRLLCRASFTSCLWTTHFLRRLPNSKLEWT